MWDGASSPPLLLQAGPGTEMKTEEVQTETLLPDAWDLAFTKQGGYQESEAAH